MIRATVLALLACLLAAAPASAVSRKRWFLPLGGGNTHDFSIGRTEIAYHTGHSHKWTLSVSPWTDDGSYVIAVLRHPPRRHEVAFALTSDVTAVPKEKAAWRFRSPVSFELGTILPHARNTGLSASLLCRGLPHGTIKPSSLRVVAHAGAPVGAVTPLDQVAQALDFACHRPGAAPYLAAL